MAPAREKGQDPSEIIEETLREHMHLLEGMQDFEEDVTIDTDDEDEEENEIENEDRVQVFHIENMNELLVQPNEGDESREPILSATSDHPDEENGADDRDINVVNWDELHGEIDSDIDSLELCDRNFDDFDFTDFTEEEREIQLTINRNDAEVRSQLRRNILLTRQYGHLLAERSDLRDVFQELANATNLLLKIEASLAKRLLNLDDDFGPQMG